MASQVIWERREDELEASSRNKLNFDAYVRETFSTCSGVSILRNIASPEPCFAHLRIILKHMSFLRRDLAPSLVVHIAFPGRLSIRYKSEHSELLATSPQPKGIYTSGLIRYFFEHRFYDLCFDMMLDIILQNI